MTKRDPDNAPPKRSGKLTWLETLVLHHRLPVNIVVHAVLFTLALLLAYLVRFDAGWYEQGEAGQVSWFFDHFLRWLPVFVVVKLIIFGRLKLFRGGWQFASIRDVASILLGAWLSCW